MKSVSGVYKANSIVNKHVLDKNSKFYTKFVYEIMTKYKNIIDKSLLLNIFPASIYDELVKSQKMTIIDGFVKRFAGKARKS